VFELIVIVIIISVVFSDRLKGIWGEIRFKLKIKIWFNDYYRLLSNTYYKTSYGTTQIDHILISPKGIFVIEVKNLGESFISGYEKQKVWTIEYTATGAEIDMKNPLHQNYGHLKTIEGIVGDSSNIKSLVIFSNAVEFDNKMPKNVINEKGFRAYYMSLNDKLLDEDAINNYYNMINKGKESSPFIGIKHYLLQRFR
jgi:hypothetical protein